MIKFFRRIRQSLLSNNRIGKYLLYAIGEIVLVVIGILIALQINNWNEQRKTNEKEIKLLRELVANLKTNQKVLIQNIEVETERIRAIDKIFEAMQGNQKNDSLVQYFRMATFREQLSISNSSYDNLKTVGLDIIRNDSLKLKISELFDVSYALEKENIDLVSTAIMNSTSSAFFANPTYLKAMMTGEFNDEKTALWYQQVLSARKSWKIDLIKGNQRILNQTITLISQIEEYISEQPQSVENK